MEEIIGTHNQLNELRRCTSNLKRADVSARVKLASIDSSHRTLSHDTSHASKYSNFAFSLYVVKIIPETLPTTPFLSIFLNSHLSPFPRGTVPASIETRAHSFLQKPIFPFPNVHVTRSASLISCFSRESLHSGRVPCRRGGMIWKCLVRCYIYSMVKYPSPKGVTQ